MVALIFVLYVLVYNDSETEVVDEFGRVISEDDVNRGVEDPGIRVDDSGTGTFTREKKDVDENLLPTRRAVIGSTSFVYPPILSYELLSTTTARLFHQTPSPEHRDYCDLKNDYPAKSSSIYDVDFGVEIYEQSVKDVIKTSFEHLSDLALDENGKIILEKVPLHAKYPVYFVTIGAEGCGQHIYFVQLGQNKTFVIKRAYIPYLNALDATSTAEYMNLPGVIVPDQEEWLVHTIIGGII